jgi:hypothetical protein
MALMRSIDLKGCAEVARWLLMVTQNPEVVSGGIRDYFGG